MKSGKPFGPASRFARWLGWDQPSFFTDPLIARLAIEAMDAWVSIPFIYLTARGEKVDPLLHRVQERRLFPTRIIQAGQRIAQERIIGRVLSNQPITSAPLPVRLLDRFVADTCEA